VIDEGIGMAPHELEHLFQPFVRHMEPSSRRGLGLGLIISQAIVNGHDGALTITSDGPGKGTSATVVLPTIDAPAVVEHPPIDTPALVPRPVRVLLVEDDADSAEMLSVILASEGFDVRVAGTLRQARLLAPDCELVVSDIALPDGSGLELMRELRARHALRGLALSGYGSSQDMQRSREAGFAEHLVKPVEIERLVDALRGLLDVPSDETAASGH
jgi:CheY-like chemotaxis protein